MWDGFKTDDNELKLIKSIYYLLNWDVDKY